MLYNLYEQKLTTFLCFIVDIILPINYLLLNKVNIMNIEFKTNLNFNL